MRSIKGPQFEWGLPSSNGIILLSSTFEPIGKPPENLRKPD